MRIAMAAQIAALLAPSLAVAQDPIPMSEPPPAVVVVPRLTLFAADIRGRVRSDEASFPAPILEGSNVHYDSDLDLDDSAPAWILEVAAFQRSEGLYLELGSVSWLEASYEGSANLDGTEIFNGRTFPAGTGVDSKLRYRSWGADYTVVQDDFVNDTVCSFRLGARYADLRVQVEGAGQETDERIRLFYLGGGLRGEARWGEWLTGLLQGSVYFSIGGYDDWWDLEYEEWGGVIFEGMAGLSGTFGPLRLEGGWRYLSNSSYSVVDNFDKFEDNDFSLELGGPYLSATLRF